MPEQADINRALEVLRERRRDFGKKHARIHEDGLDFNFHRRRALEGICGSCANLNLEFGNDGGRPTAVLKCRVGKMPLRLYESTPLGEEAVCDKHQPSKVSA